MDFYGFLGLSFKSRWIRWPLWVFDPSTRGRSCLRLGWTCLELRGGWSTASLREPGFSCVVLGNPKSYREWMTLALNWTLRNFVELVLFCAFGSPWEALVLDSRNATAMNWLEQHTSKDRKQVGESVEHLHMICWTMVDDLLSLHIIYCNII